MAEFKITVERGFDETLNKQKAMNDQMFADYENQLKQLAQAMNANKEELEGFNFKHKQAI